MRSPANETSSLYEKEVIRGNYYPHIDGLRAFAVLSVLLFHAFPSACTGGFIGVDVFFVISGYLITKGLLSDLEKGQYSIGTFYIRRIRRIFPAYLAVIIFTLCGGICVYYGENLTELAKTAFSSAFFLTNIYFSSTSGYFSPNAHNNALLNLWSLSVEEQFYVFFPLLLAALHKYFPKRIKTGVWTLAIVSFLLSCYSVNVKMSLTTAFYGLPFRAWELLAGCLLAIHCRERFLKKEMAFPALILLLVSFFVLDESIPFPGLTAIIPISCAVILLYSGCYGRAKCIMEHSITVFIGKISYSLYLIHWPVIVLCRWIFGTSLSSVYIGLIAITLSFTLSYLSWKHLETPIRRTKWRRPAYFLFGTAVCTITIAASTFTFLLSHHEKQAPIVHVEPYWDGNPPDKAQYPDPAWPHSENRKKDSFFALGNGKNYEYVLWGDSHAMSLSPGFFDFSQKTGINGLYINRKHTLLHNTYSPLYPDNDKWIDGVLTWLQQQDGLHTVILANRWAVRATGTAPESRTPLVFVRRDKIGKSTEEIFRLGLTELCERIQKMKKNVIIISSIPEQGIHIPAEMNKFGLFFHSRKVMGVNKDVYNKRQETVNHVFRELESKGLAKIIWLDTVFFEKDGSFRSLILDGNISMYTDDDHLSPSGARLVLNHIRERLEETIRNTKPVHN